MQPIERVLAEFRKTDFFLAALVFSQMIQRGVNGDFAEPMLKRRAAVKLIQRTPGLEERVLREVLEPVMIPLVAIENGKDMGLMAADKFGKLFLRAVSDSLQQFGIVAHWAFGLRTTLQLVGAVFRKASQRLSGPVPPRRERSRQGKDGATTAVIYSEICTDSVDGARHEFAIARSGDGCRRCGVSQNLHTNVLYGIKWRNCYVQLDGRTPFCNGAITRMPTTTEPLPPTSTNKKGVFTCRMARL